MKTINLRHAAALAFGSLTLLASALLAPVTFAQDAAPAVPTKNITLSLHHVSILTALQSLFSGAGIRNSIIDNDVQGYVNVDLSDRPFNLALQDLLDSVNPKLTYDNSNGVYHVSVLKSAPPAPPVYVPTPAPQDPDSGGSTTDQPKRFYRIPIDKYDAYYIASLLGAQGIVRVGINDVVPASGSGGGGGGLSGINSGISSNRGFGGSSIFGNNGSNISSYGGTGFGSTGYGGGTSGYGNGYGTTNRFGGYRGF